MRTLGKLCAALILAGLVGCMPEYQPDEQGYGDSVIHNAALQVVNPAPSRATEPDPYDGGRAAEAWDRYRADKVRPPVRVTTTGGGGTGGGGGAGASAGAGAQ